MNGVSSTIRIFLNSIQDVHIDHLTPSSLAEAAHRKMNSATQDEWDDAFMRALKDAENNAWPDDRRQKLIELIRAASKLKPRW